MDHYTKLAQLIRYHVISSTTKAKSGHLTSSLSAVEIMTVLMYGGFFKYDITKPHFHNNDRLIFSKGHASPLFYALWALVEGSDVDVSELETLRQFGSRLEGHPTMEFPYTEVATGSLGQGLSVGVGMALNAKHIDDLPYKTFVLLGDSEMAEGSNWEAMQIAAHYELDNLVGIIDVNRLGQRGETMYGHDLSAYARRAIAFGWHAIEVDGHDVSELHSVYKSVEKGETDKNKPVMIIARTEKGYGVSAIQDKENWHGKPLPEDKADEAIKELGDIDFDIRGTLPMPDNVAPRAYSPKEVNIDEDYDEPLAPRKAYGHALVHLHKDYPDMVVLDAEVSNSTYSIEFKKAYPERFFEMFIAEQNMVGVAAGLSARGKIPFVSTFGSFFTRALDQIRVSQYSKSSLNFIGSHVGVSIGHDGATQMGLEDMAIFRAVLGSVVLYPADHVSQEQLTKAMIEHDGICYMRTTRMDTEPLYEKSDVLAIGGSHTFKQSDKDVATVVAAGVTLYEALDAYEHLKKENISVRIIDAYSIKPIDVETLRKAALETHTILTVEDHFAEGGLGAAVRQALADRRVKIHSLAVTKMPKSGEPHELLDYEGISAKHIKEKILKIVKQQ